MQAWHWGECPLGGEHPRDARTATVGALARQVNNVKTPEYNA